MGSEGRRTKKVVVIVPAYNEGARIGKVISGIPKTITTGSQTFAVDIVVVDDGSRDDTYKRARRGGRATVLRHMLNCGAGAATRTGLKYAAGIENLGYVVTIDADGQHKSKEIQRLVSFAEEHGSAFVVGNRLHAANRKNIPIHRTIGNNGLGFIGRVLFGIRVKDTQSGLRLLRADVVPQIYEYTIDRYGFCTEMLWRAVQRGIRIEEIPIDIKYSTETLQKGQNPWGAIELLLDLFWVRISE